MEEFAARRGTEHTGTKLNANHTLRGDHEEGALSSLRLGTQALLAFRIPSVDMEEVNRLRTGCIASFMLRWPASANAPAEACDLS
jgi:hypothetical protein